MTKFKYKNSQNIHADKGGSGAFGAFGGNVVVTVGGRERTRRRDPDRTVVLRGAGADGGRGGRGGIARGDDRAGSGGSGAAGGDGGTVVVWRGAGGASTGPTTLRGALVGTAATGQVGAPLVAARSLARTVVRCLVASVACSQTRWPGTGGRPSSRRRRRCPNKSTFVGGSGEFGGMERPGGGCERQREDRQWWQRRDGRRRRQRGCRGRTGGGRPQRRPSNTFIKGGSDGGGGNGGPGGNARGKGNAGNGGNGAFGDWRAGGEGGCGDRGPHQLPASHGGRCWTVRGCFDSGGECEQGCRSMAGHARTRGGVVGGWGWWAS